jgi:hypothetical protein
MLTPRKYEFVLSVEVLADFEDMEAMSRQMHLVDDPDQIIQEAKDIIDELDSVEGIIHEDAGGIADVIAARWPFNVTVALRATGRSGHPEKPEG